MIFLIKILIILLILTVRFGPGWEIHKVVEVLDGDTVIIENGDHIRYIGVDTPETIHPEKPIECYGEEATERNKELVLNRYVLLERDIEDVDEYGRYLRYIYVLQGSVSEILVREGYGYSYYYQPNLKHYDRLMNLELEAIDQNMGLWGNCY